MSEPSNFQDAVDYVTKVQTTYKDNPEIYRQFLKLLGFFQTKKTDHKGVIIEIQELFKGNDELIQGFNAFLPPDQQIQTIADMDLTDM
eukprot:gene7306-11625_t